MQRLPEDRQLPRRKSEGSNAQIEANGRISLPFNLADQTGLRWSKEARSSSPLASDNVSLFEMELVDGEIGRQSHNERELAAIVRH